MIAKNKTQSTFDILNNQKQAMKVITTEIGIPMTVQVEKGLNLYFMTHKELLNRHGYTVTETSITQTNNE